MYVFGHHVVQNPARPCPPEILKSIIGLYVPYLDLDGKLQRGLVEIHHRLAPDVAEFFKIALKIEFLFASVRPISDFAFSDTLSMAANNTSGFNNRTYISKTDGKEYTSTHALACSFDVNPWFNPDIQGAIRDPAEADYIPSRPGTLTRDSPLVIFLKEQGWTWGGDWESHQDMMHLENTRWVLPA